MLSALTRVGLGGPSLTYGVISNKTPAIPPAAAPSFITLQVSGVNPTFEVSSVNPTFEVSH